jgi:hypothetical protein
VRGAIGGELSDYPEVPPELLPMHIDVSNVQVTGSQPSEPPALPRVWQVNPLRLAPSHCSFGSITPLPQPAGSVVWVVAVVVVVVVSGSVVESSPVVVPLVVVVVVSGPVVGSGCVEVGGVPLVVPEVELLDVPGSVVLLVLEAWDPVNPPGSISLPQPVTARPNTATEQANVRHAIMAAISQPGNEGVKRKARISHRAQTRP